MISSVVGLAAVVNLGQLRDGLVALPCGDGVADREPDVGQLGEGRVEVFKEGAPKWSSTG